MRKPGTLLLAGMLALNIAMWLALTHAANAPSWSGMIKGLSVSPYGRNDDPQVGRHPTLQEVTRDMDVLASATRRIRTYSVEGVLADIPALAEARGMTVALGAWVDTDNIRNRREVATAIELARRSPAVNRVLVGNEALLREDISVPDLIFLIKRAKEAAGKPVSTAEPWHVWHDHPELAAAVDFIGLHILPYWEGVPVDEAVKHVKRRIREINEAYPDKPVVLTEVGWPSDGRKIGVAEGTRVNQAQFLREFLNVAADEGIDYYLMEAFDQPWKVEAEGTAGAYWGIFNAAREPKFEMSGEITNLPQWATWAAIGAVIVSLIVALFLRKVRGLRNLGWVFMFSSAQVVSSMLAWAIAVGSFKYLSTWGVVVWVVLMGAQLMLMLVLISDSFEIAEVVWGRHRAHRPIRKVRPDRLPMVSIHIPCYNEPPEMVCDTLRALARLDYPNFEVIVVDNNTKDDAVWKPVERFCQELGPQFRFYHLPKWPGFKAGALNFALKETAPEAAVIAVIDSDYMVAPNWLKALVPYFQRPKVAIVQAPQDYRDGDDTPLKTACFWEYAGFFKIGMVQRDRRNAIIQHGTMTMVRRTALEQVGGWAEWCITEDAELGLRLFEEGWQAIYVAESFGKGLMPDTFDAYRKQRFRWAYGAIQILKRHWRDLLFGRRLTFGQRYHFVAGWLPWIADGLTLPFTAVAIAWTAALIVIPRWVDFPIAIFVVPTIGFFLFRVMHSMTLYKAHVDCPMRERMLALLAGLSLTYTIGKAVLAGIFTSGRPFLRTPKCADRAPLIQALAMVQEETLTTLLLWSGIVGVLVVNGPTHTSALLWSAVLFAQSLPHLAAIAMALLSVAPSRHSQPSTSADSGVGAADGSVVAPQTAS